MINRISYKTSNLIYEFKAIAIVSVAAAHTATGSNGSSIGSISDQLLSAFGVVGVLSFLFISGYLFSFENRNQSDFLKNKYITIIVPWVAVGSVMYIISSVNGIQKEQLTAINWLLFLIGHKTYLYFMTILVGCYLAGMIIRKNSTLLILSILITVISIFLTSIKIFDLNPYLNPFNWIGYFSFGLLVGQNYRGLRQKILKITSMYGNKIAILVTIAISIVLVSSISVGLSVTYWNIYGILFAYSANLLIFLALQNHGESKMLKSIGVKSFTIYLLHMPVAGVINMLMTKFDYLIILKPIMVIIITMLGMKLLYTIALKVKMERFICLIIGRKFHKQI